MKKIFYLVAILTFFSCDNDDKLEDNISPEVLSGGETTIFSSGPDAFTFPLANLDQENVDLHFLADGVFGQQFVSAPSDQAGGLGPIFNQNSCESCHVRNGRGIVPQYSGDPNTGLLLRISLPGLDDNNNARPVPGFGLQFQPKAIFGTTSEGSLTHTEVTSIVEYLDGTQMTLVKPEYELTNTYINLPDNVLISPRLAPGVQGLGLLEAIAESDILALEDVSDIDGDGISGKANLVYNILKDDYTLGRFGWKAEQPTAGQQAAAAAHDDMGLTNFYFPEEGCDGQSNCEDGLQDNLDIDDQTVDLMAFYFQTVAVPARRNVDDTKVIKGETLFATLKCGSCHTPSFVTGNHDIPELSNQQIYPYTDLLLHDMGEGLADHRPTFLANGNEWRTPPLWGIGLTQVVNSKATYLHDGRAKTIEEAILWHGGEAQNSRDEFMALDKDERESLIAFVNSI